MAAYWIYDCGQLVARNEAGAVLYECSADEEHGRPLAYLLNHAPALSRLLLRHSTDKLCESALCRHTFP
jgi:hypothetical protein